MAVSSNRGSNHTYIIYRVPSGFPIWPFLAFFPRAKFFSFSINALKLIVFSGGLRNQSLIIYRILRTSSSQATSVPLTVAGSGNGQSSGISIRGKELVLKVTTFTNTCNFNRCLIRHGAFDLANPAANTRFSINLWYLDSNLGTT